MENIKETPSIRDIAQVASRLQYGALAELLEAMRKLEKCPNEKFLEPAISRLNEAWSLSENKMQKEDFEKHPSNWQKIFEQILHFKEEDFKRFFRLLAHFLNNDAEKDFKKGRKKLADIILVSEGSVTDYLRKAAGYGTSIAQAKDKMDLWYLAGRLCDKKLQEAEKTKIIQKIIESRDPNLILHAIVGGIETMRQTPDEGTQRTLALGLKKLMSANSIELEKLKDILIQISGFLQNPSRSLSVSEEVRQIFKEIILKNEENIKKLRGLNDQDINFISRSVYEKHGK